MARANQLRTRPEMALWASRAAAPARLMACGPQSDAGSETRHRDFQCVCSSPGHGSPPLVWWPRAGGGTIRDRSHAHVLITKTSVPQTMASCEPICTESVGDKPAGNQWFRLPDFKVTKSKIASLGASAIISYGAVSNLNMSICAIMALRLLAKALDFLHLRRGLCRSSLRCTRDTGLQ